MGSAVMDSAVVGSAVVGINTASGRRRTAPWWAQNASASAPGMAPGMAPASKMASSTRASSGRRIEMAVNS